MKAKVYCLRCEADKRRGKGMIPLDNTIRLFSKNEYILHNIMCEHATDESIKQAGENHMNRFTALWTAVAYWLNPEKKV